MNRTSNSLDGESMSPEEVLLTIIHALLMPGLKKDNRLPCEKWE